jgi:hypothetical protein
MARELLLALLYIALCNGKTLEPADQTMTFRPGDGLKPGNKTRAKITSAKMLEGLTEPGRYPDSEVPGLGLVIASEGRRSWVLRYQIAKRPRSMGLVGRFSDFERGRSDRGI